MPSVSLRKMPPKPRPVISVLCQLTELPSYNKCHYFFQTDCNTLLYTPSHTIFQDHLSDGEKTMRTLKQIPNELILYQCHFKEDIRLHLYSHYIHMYVVRNRIIGFMLNRFPPDQSPGLLGKMFFPRTNTATVLCSTIQRQQ